MIRAGAGGTRKDINGVMRGVGDTTVNGIIIERSNTTISADDTDLIITPG